MTPLPRRAEITLQRAVATLGLAEVAVHEMIGACETAYPAEACGLILDDGTVIPTTNLAENPRRAYVIPPEAVARASERIIGVFHSHPDGVAEASASDRAQMHAGWRYIVIATRGPVVTDAVIV